MQLCSVKSSLFSDYIIHHISRPYGNFYLFDHFVVSEINEGVVFGGLEALDIFTYIMEFYNGIKRPKHFVYISNRINCYVLKPADWLDFDFMGRFLVGYAIVDSSPSAHIKADLEKKFVPCEFEVFEDLMTGIKWALNTHSKHA